MVSVALDNQPIELVALITLVTAGHHYLLLLLQRARQRLMAAVNPVSGPAALVTPNMMVVGPILDMDPIQGTAAIRALSS